MANQVFHGGINAPSVNGITPAQNDRPFTEVVCSDGTVSV
jgi:hypothetical protein